MSNETIDQSKVDQYSANVFHLSQQKESRLKPLVRNEPLKGESGYYDRYAAGSAPTKKSGRHSATPVSSVDHSRRKVTGDEYEDNILVDDLDTLSMIHDPTSQYAKIMAMKFGRQIDDIIIAEALGDAFSGRAGATTVAFPSSQKVVAHDGSTTTGVNLNVKTLRKVKEKFMANEVDNSMKKFLACSASQIMSLLAQTEVTSSDYNIIKTLVQGEINTFMGFEFIQIERLAKATANVTYNVNNGAFGSGTGTITISSNNARKCIAWCHDGVLLAIKKETKSRISERADLSYNMQVYYCMNMGATRMEEAKVVEVICAEVA